MKTQVLLKKTLPVVKDLKSDKAEVLVVLYDNKLKAVVDNLLQQADVAIGLSSGESLKTLKSLETVTQKLLNRIPNQSRQHLVFVAIGGGSVGDFVGFLASVFKRGVRLIHIPTTSLAAIDSAHGGKTALNIAGIKNQLGTFYPAEKVVISKKILNSQPQNIQRAAQGEFFKTCLLDKKLFFQMSQEKIFTQNIFWKYLPEAIAIKTKIVSKDPFESKGVRQVLNLGHTFGHIFESHLKKPHGEAVFLGCLWSLSFSYQQGYLSLKKLNQCYVLAQKFNLRLNPRLSSITKANFLKLLSKDKKISSSHAVSFVFVTDIGKTQVAKVKLSALFEFAKKQGYIK